MLTSLIYPDRNAQRPSHDMQFLALAQLSQSTEVRADQTFDVTDDSLPMIPSSNPPSTFAHSLTTPISNLNNAESSCDTSKWIKSRRPTNPDLYCCDYNKVEAAIREGVAGKEEYCGAHLCLECLGVEYRDVDQDESCT